MQREPQRMDQAQEVRHGKKEKSEMPKRICRHWMGGRCTYGAKCNFRHPTEMDPKQMKEYQRFQKEKREATERREAERSNRRKRRGRTPRNVCRHWMAGRCEWADECRFKHVGVPAGERVCRDYQRGNCQYGPDCRYRHQRKWVRSEDKFAQNQMRPAGPMNNGPPRHARVSPPSREQMNKERNDGFQAPSNENQHRQFRATNQMHQGMQGAGSQMATMNHSVAHGSTQNIGSMQNPNGQNPVVQNLGQPNPPNVARETRPRPATQADQVRYEQALTMILLQHDRSKISQIPSLVHSHSHDIAELHGLLGRVCDMYNVPKPMMHGVGSTNAPMAFPNGMDMNMGGPMNMPSMPMSCSMPSMPLRASLPSMPMSCCMPSMPMSANMPSMPMSSFQSNQSPNQLPRGFNPMNTPLTSVPMLGVTPQHMLGALSTAPNAVAQRQNLLGIMSNMQSDEPVQPVPSTQTQHSLKEAMDQMAGLSLKEKDNWEEGASEQIAEVQSDPQLQSETDQA